MKYCPILGCTGWVVENNEKKFVNLEKKSQVKKIKNYEK